MMKLLFVDQSQELQTKWIEPLRSQGWGVVRARSAEDAERMMVLHGEALEAIVTGEQFVTWTEKQGLPFAVLTSTWNEKEIIKHRSGQHPAIGYLLYQSSIETLQNLLDISHSQEHALQATGTDRTSASILPLEDYSGILSKPEPTRVGTSSLQFDAPPVQLGGKANLSLVPEVEEMVIEPEAPAIEGTMVIDPTKHFELDLASDDEPLLDEDGGFAEHTQLEIRPLEELLADSAFGKDAFEEEVEVEATRIFSGTTTTIPTVAPVAPVTLTPLEIPKSPARSEESDTLRNYLSIREQDVAMLSGQYRSTLDRVEQLESILKVQKARNTELSHLVAKHERKLHHYDQEKQVEHEILEKQIEDLNDQLKTRTEKVRIIESKLKLTVDEIGKVKERVRVDIRRIRVREKELEAQLEVLKKDSSALLQSRDEKITELKRKIDLLEFNMELAQEQYAKEKRTSDELKSKLRDAATVMKQANGLLEQ